MTTTDTMRSTPPRPLRALATVIIFILPLVSCSLSFDMPWDKTVTPGSQKKTAKTEATPGQPKSEPTPEPSSDASEDGRKWTKYNTDEDDVKHFYDENAVVRSSGNIIQIWRKREFPSGAAQRRIVTLEEIDCGKAEYRTVELRVTYSDGTTGRSDKPTRWAKIFENSHEAYFMREHCK